MQNHSKHEAAQRGWGLEYAALGSPSSPDRKGTSLHSCPEALVSCTGSQATAAPASADHSGASWATTVQPHGLSDPPGTSCTNAQTVPSWQSDHSREGRRVGRTRAADS